MLWVVAVILVIAGIVALIRGAILYGIVFIVLGFVVGPGGVSVFTSRVRRPPQVELSAAR